ncbi:hypothetical protein ABEG17_04355 [Pedococcus sp. KACC 23699]|uniref:Polyketide antibiotic transporter n=1 Tax=Pedococcus sp. KACC 23699 TaxID=3149228 RepID=A0AAU7JVZ9_9MICO
MRSGFTGTVRLTRLALRRDRVTLPAWVVGMAAFTAATTALFNDNYTRHPELLGLDTRIVVENPGMRVLGLVTGPTVGGYALHRDGLTLAVLAAMMSVLAVVRHTRQSEELGREEILGAGVVGRYASLTAATAVTLAANLALALMLALGLMLAGQPVAGSMVGGASIALVGVFFTGVAAVTSQLASTSRGAIGLASAGLGAAFGLAALGNMTGTVDAAALRVTSTWPTWLSPIGWGQQMRPFADDLWWPLGLAVVGVGCLFLVSVTLAARRDVGRGMWPERRGASLASPALLSPFGLVWRLQRGTLLGWSLGLVGFGLIFGALSDQISGLTGAATQWYKGFGGEADLLGAYWASMMQIAGTTVSIYVATIVLRLHHDEAQGTAESVLATAVSRLRWLGAYALNALAGATVLMGGFALAMGITGGSTLGGTPALLGDLVGAAAVQLPAIAVLGAAALAVTAVVPRWSPGLVWALVVATIVTGPMFGPSLGLPSWLLNLSPFTHVPNAPATAATPAPILGLSLAGLLLALWSITVIRRRNLALPA